MQADPTVLYRSLTKVSKLKLIFGAAGATIGAGAAGKEALVGTAALTGIAAAAGNAAEVLSPEGKKDASPAGVSKAANPVPASAASASGVTITSLWTEPSRPLLELGKPVLSRTGRLELGKPAVFVKDTYASLLFDGGEPPAFCHGSLPSRARATICRTVAFVVAKG